MRKILYVLGNVLLTVLVILLIGYGWAFFEIKIMLKSNPELFGYVFYQVETDDMATDFNIDDIAIIKKDASYSNGDRIFYLNEDSEYKLETVVSVDSLSTVTSCNTCIENSDPIDNSAVIGKAIGKVTWIGMLIKFFKQKAVLITMAVIGFALVIISQSIGVKPKES